MAERRQSGRADYRLHRRQTSIPSRGIALALKLKAVAYAQARGNPTIKTWNAQKNRPMLAINERLGFVKQPAWITFKKKMNVEEAEATSDAK